MALDPKLKDSVAFLRDHAHGMRAVLDLADAIGDISVLENAASEAERRRAAALDDLDTEIHKRNATLANLEATILSTKATAEGLIDDAKEQAAGIIDAARADALKEANRVKAAADADLAGVTKQLDEAKAALGDVRRELAAVSAERDQAVVDRDAAKADEAKARAFIASLKGA
jgi:hypothetical protein